MRSARRSLLYVLIAMSILALTAPSRAQSTAPPEGPAAVAAPNGSFALSGAIYLYDYTPVLAGASDKFEIYAFLLNIDAATKDGRYGLHVQTRARDSKLRSFYLSNVWFQEAYAWAKTPAGDIHAGKFYARVGIPWDDSFFGNIQYFNGLKLHPLYGVELVGTRPAGGPLSVDYSTQFLVNNANTDGSLPGRDVESDPNARVHDAVTARVVPTWNFSGGSSLALGLSGYEGRIERTQGPAFRIRQASADLSWMRGPSITYVEILSQKGERDDAQHPFSRPGYDDGTYLLAGTRWQVLSWLNARVNYSQVVYGGEDSKEQEIVPGLVFTLHKHVALITEFDYWRAVPHSGPALLIDRSYNFVADYTF